MHVLFALLDENLSCAMCGIPNVWIDVQTRTHARKDSAQGVKDATMHGQEVSCAAHEVREMRAAHNQICSALTQLAALDDKEELVSKEPAADVNVSQAIQRLKTQKLDVWHEIQHLRKVSYPHQRLGFLK